MTNYEIKERRVATVGGTDTVFIRYGLLDADGVWFGRSLRPGEDKEIAVAQFSKRFDLVGWENVTPPGIGKD